MAGDRDRASRYPLPAQRGLKLFIGDANCNLCHLGPRYERRRVRRHRYPVLRAAGRGGFGPAGRLEAAGGQLFQPARQIQRRHDGQQRSVRHVQRQHTNFGEFRVPGRARSGRGGPYMHNGSVLTLEDVVKHYSK